MDQIDQYVNTKTKFLRQLFLYGWPFAFVLLWLVILNLRVNFYLCDMLSIGTSWFAYLLILGIVVFIIFRQYMVAISSVLSGVMILGMVYFYVGGFNQNGISLPANENIKIRVIAFNTGGGQHVDADRFFEWCKSKQVNVLVLVQTGPADEKLKRRLQNELQLQGVGYGPSAVFTGWPTTLIRSNRPDPKDEFEIPYHSAPAMKWVAAAQVSENTRLFILPLQITSPRTASRWIDSQDQTRFRADIAKTILRQTGSPILAVGDLNATPINANFHIFSKYSGLEPLTDGWRTKGTWPGSLSPWLALPIDHIFASDVFSVVHQEIGPDFGSDHRPIYMEMNMAIDKNP